MAKPRLRRRFAAFVYEGVVLFGVLMLAGLLYSSLTQQHHALQGRHGLQFFLFLVLGVYFVWFWSHGGQTVAMRTWHIRVVRNDGQALGQAQALARYLVAWLWFIPALSVAALMGWQTGATLSASIVGGVLGYLLITLLMPDRQFLHDRLCGTRLIVWDAREARDKRRAAALSSGAGTMRADDQPA